MKIEPTVYVGTDITDKDSYAITTCIYVLDNDIHIGGYLSPYGKPATAVYWKNGVMTKLTNGTSSSFVSDICITK